MKSRLGYTIACARPFLSAAQIRPILGGRIASLPHPTVTLPLQRQFSTTLIAHKPKNYPESTMQSILDLLNKNPNTSSSNSNTSNTPNSPNTTSSTDTTTTTTTTPPSSADLISFLSISSDSLSTKPIPKDGTFNPNRATTELTSFASILQSAEGPPPIQEDTRLPRMGPTAGRSVLVQGDVVAAFTRLRTIVAQNRVRGDLAKQRFHERPGLKKKRLKRERHRRRFKEGFKRMVGIVLDMKNRGM